MHLQVSNTVQLKSVHIRSLRAVIPMKGGDVSGDL